MTVHKSKGLEADNIIIINVLMTVLFYTRKKKQSLYLFASFYYFILFVLSFIFFGAITSIQFGKISSTFAGILKDVSSFIYLLNYYFIFVFLAKSVGFNFKTLKFNEIVDLRALDEDDDNEIEISINRDINHNKKNFIHLSRELKYYVLENLFVFKVLGILLIILVFGSLYYTFRITNKKYNQSQSVSLSNFNLNVKESYITNIDYSGNIISKNKKFLVLKVAISNISGMPSTIDSAFFRLYVNKQILYPSYDKAASFKDLAKPYQGEKISDSKESDYVFAYEIDMNYEGTYKLKFINSLTKNKKNIKTSYKIVSLKPIDLMKKNIIKDGLKLNETIKLDEFGLEDTKYELNSIEISTKYNYIFRQCDYLSNCRDISKIIVPSFGNVFVVIKDKIKWDEDLIQYKNNTRDFYSDFGYILVGNNLDGKFYKLKKVYLSGKSDEKVYEVSDLVKNVNNYKFVFSNRNRIIILSN